MLIAENTGIQIRVIVENHVMVFPEPLMKSDLFDFCNSLSSHINEEFAKHSYLPDKCAWVQHWLEVRGWKILKACKRSNRNIPDDVVY